MPDTRYCNTGCVAKIRRRYDDQLVQQLLEMQVIADAKRPDWEWHGPKG